MISFKFKGEDSYDNYGIIIPKRPVIPSPKRRVSYIDVPGRNSRLRFDEGTFEDITITVECSIKGNDIMERLDNIKGWLFSEGESDLIFSFQNDKRYRAQVVNAIDFQQIYKVISRFPIIFSCRPFKYSTVNEKIQIYESGTTIINPGNFKSEPIIFVYGQGNIELRINEESIMLKDIQSNIILNTELQDAYDENGTSLNHKMEGEFLTLYPGNNKISWEGNINKIEIIPNWRWI